ncbi:MAG: hypothetical protein WCJ26_05845 [bacterium]
MKTINLITKKTIYILAAILGLQFNSVSANSAFSGAAIITNETVSGISNAGLMPATPLEATFDDNAETNSPAIDISLLSPAIPAVADFNDGAPSTEFNLINLAPVTPKEASFEDETEVKGELPATVLAPATPLRADFEETL